MLALFVIKNIWKIDDNMMKQVIFEAKDLVEDYKDLIHDVLSYITEYDKKYRSKKKLLQLEDEVLEEEEKFMKTTLTTGMGKER